MAGKAQRGLTAYTIGRLAYADALALQRRLVELRKLEQVGDSLLLLEHDPVVTLGRDGKRDSLLFDDAGYDAQGIQVFESDRGGDATYHGPGQVVAYPIVDLSPDQKDIRKYVFNLEEAMIRTLAAYDLSGRRLSGSPGVWLTSPDRKIGAIGARISRWVTHHGLALNVNTNLAHFETIVPCGIQNKGVTSLQRELGRLCSMSEVMNTLASHLADTLGRVLRHGDNADLSIGELS